ncbi:hypothetical protein F5887DRAFT_917667 [Amanita rubescens]|nr:hypothetical protein F5887DRAFT_917667 [Amanita rubescens]
MHRRKSRRDAESVREDESQEEDEPKLKQITFGSSSELSESATKVEEDIKEKDEEADKEDDISSHTPSSLLFYQHSQERSVMQFFKMGIFRATPSAESQVPGRMSSGAREFSEPRLASGAHGTVPDYDDPYNHIADDGTCTFRPPAPAFHACSSRPRSFSESTIIAPTKSSTHSPILTPSSLPSSPPINAGTEYQNCHSTFSLSLSDRLERLNKQIQKKTSTSSLKAASGVSLNEAGVGAFEMGREGGGGSKRGGIGHIRSESSMDFKCCGLPESGTFSKLSDAEATMRAADELATKQRLSGSIY